MLQLKNRLKYCSVAIAANRLVSGPKKNPMVFMDIAADGDPIGRIIIEASHDLLKLNSTKLLVMLHKSMKRRLRSRNEYKSLWCNEKSEGK